MKKALSIFVLLSLWIVLPAQEPPKAATPDRLEAIREQIRQNGYAYTVAHNWVFDMSPEQKKHFLGRHPSRTPVLRDEPGPLREHMGRRMLPTAFDWRNVAGHTYIGPVRNQGSCGSCYAFAAAACAEGVYNKANNLTDGQCADFSESFIAWCLGRLEPYSDHFFGCDGADYDYQELQALCDVGICSEASFPYQQSDPGSCTHMSDPRVQFQNWYRIPCGDVEAIKTAIMTYGVVDAAVWVSDLFQAYDGGIFEDDSTCYSNPCYYTPTNHAIALVGWDDNGGDGYFILRNSWGTSWGEAGYMRIKYHAARVACEACYMVYQEPASLTLTAPDGGEVWRQGEQRSITWTVSGYSGNLVIELLQNGVLKGVVASSVPAASGSYTWTVGVLENLSRMKGTGWTIRIRTPDSELVAVRTLSP